MNLGIQTVDDANLVPAFDQRIDQMRADEPGTTRNRAIQISKAVTKGGMASVDQTAPTPIGPPGSLGGASRYDFNRHSPDSRQFQARFAPLAGAGRRPLPPPLGTQASRTYDCT